MKSLTVMAGLALLLAAIDAHAQPAILQSPPVAKVRVCLNALTEDGKKAGLQTDRIGGAVLILNPTRRELLPLLVSMTTCLDAALPKTELVKNPDTGTRSRIWYIFGDGYYAWCATNSLNKKETDIDVLGGSGPQRAWYALTVKCEVTEQILGFYAPKN